MSTKHTHSHMRNREGQAMLLTAVAMGGTLLVITAVAGLITLYQLRQLSNVTNSAKAIFAAEAGLEWGVYQFRQFMFYANSPSSLVLDGKEPPTPFSNGAVYATRCYDISGVLINTTTTITGVPLPGPPYTACDFNSTAVIRAIGRNRGVSRAVQLSILTIIAGP